MDEEIDQIKAYCFNIIKFVQNSIYVKYLDVNSFCFVLGCYFQANLIACPTLLLGINESTILMLKSLTDERLYFVL